MFQLRLMFCGQFSIFLYRFCTPQPQGSWELQKKQSSKLPELSQTPIAAPPEKGMFPYNSKAPGSAGTIGTGFPALKNCSRVTENLTKPNQTYDEDQE